MKNKIKQVRRKEFYPELVGLDETKPVSDYDLKYKYGLNFTQRVLVRIINRLGKNPLLIK